MKRELGDDDSRKVSEIRINPKVSLMKMINWDSPHFCYIFLYFRYEIYDLKPDQFKMLQEDSRVHAC